MNIKAVFLDVDGTLLNRNNSVPQSTQDAIGRLREKGILTVVASGRQIDSYAALPVNHIRFDAYIMLNGAMLLDENRKIISGTPMNREALDLIFRLFGEHRIPYALSTAAGRYINTVDETVIRTHREIRTAVPKEGKYSGEDVYMVEAYVPEKERPVLESLRDCCTITWWHDTGTDIVPKGMDKAVGINQFLKLHNLKKEQIIAFGDAENDISMLSYAGIGVAMGNAGQSVKDAADYVTDTSDNDGIEKALKHFGLI